ncbi:hypothetical protein HS7_10930 [Sulfolobales archaeon HS-7]|nr:hypothetical protein HS7_10930 [Sulfolobales archaeon HS-7]
MGQESEINKLRLSLLYLGISSLITFAVTIFTFSYLGSVAVEIENLVSSSVNPAATLGDIVSLLTIVGVVSTISSIIIAVFNYLGYSQGHGSLNNLKSSFPDRGFSPTGMTLVLIGGILGIIGGLGMFIVIGIFVYVITFILYLIGFILIGKSIMAIGNSGSNTLATIGGVLTAIPFIWFTGLFISYIALGRKLSPLATPQPTTQPYYYQPPTPMQQTPVYQLGNGTISENGEGYLALYSNGVYSIFTIDINGLTVISFQPNVIYPGRNFLTIKFDPSQAISPGNVYSGVIRLSNGIQIPISIRRA